MSDVNQTQTPPPANPADSSAGTQNTGDGGKIPYERFQEVVKQKNDFEAKLKEFEGKLAEYAKRDEDARIAAEKKQRDELASQNKHAEALTAAERELEELRVYKTEVEKLRESTKKALERRLEKVPDHIKSLLAQMQPQAALDWLDENSDKIAGRQAPPTNSGSSGGRQEAAYNFSEKHLEDVAIRYGIKPPK